jgi:hypothetical protein
MLAQRQPLFLQQYPSHAQKPPHPLPHTHFMRNPHPRLLLHRHPSQEVDEQLPHDALQVQQLLLLLLLQSDDDDDEQEDDDDDEEEEEEEQLGHQHMQSLHDEELLLSHEEEVEDDDEEEQQGVLHSLYFFLWHFLCFLWCFFFFPFLQVSEEESPQLHDIDEIVGAQPCPIVCFLAIGI